MKSIVVKSKSEHHIDGREMSLLTVLIEVFSVVKCISALSDSSTAFDMALRLFPSSGFVTRRCDEWELFRKLRKECHVPVHSVVVLSV